jgi:hypothetical protein
MNFRRPIDWNSIVVVRSGGRELTVEQLRAEIDNRNAELVFDPDREPEELPPPLALANNKVAAAQVAAYSSPNARLAKHIEISRANNLQVCSISIDANVGHWLKTVEANGIVLHLYPLSGDGAVVPIDGTLEVELIASVPAGSPLGVPLPRIARWTIRITPDQFGADGAIFKLPFQSVHPEFDLNYGPYGVVHAKLSVSGNGAFETSAAMVRIRPYSAVRDESQQLTGQRFFDVERVERWGR